jgi:cell division protein FtsL
MIFKRWIPLWSLPLIALLAIGTVWLRLSMVRTSYAINQTNQEIHALEQAKEQMELRVTGLRSPRKLEQLARAKGLTQPRAEQVIHIVGTDLGALGANDVSRSR